MKLRCSSILKAALALVLAVILLAGTTVTGFSAIVDELAATGSNFTGGAVYYLDPNIWNDSNYRYAAYFIGTGGTTTWVDFVKVDSLSTIYKVAVPSDGITYNQMIFARMNPSYPDNDWNNRVNQTGNITADSMGNDNLVEITSYTDNVECNYITRSHSNFTTLFITNNLSQYSSKTLNYSYVFGSTYNNAWPGKKFTDWPTYTEGESTYYYKTFDIPDENFQVILHDNSGIQTNDSDPQTSGKTYKIDGYDSGKASLSDICRVSFVRNGHGIAPDGYLVDYGTNVSTPAALTCPGFTFQGWYTDAACTAAFTGTTVTADLTLYAKWSGYGTKKHQAFYFDGSVAGSGTAFSGTPKFRFNTVASDSGATTWTNATQVKTDANAYRTGVYFIEAPDNGYTYLQVSNSEGTNISGWKAITDAHANTITYINDKFNGLGMPYSNHPETSYGDGSTANAHVYFDNTNTDWDLSGSDKLYFILGRHNYQKAYQMTAVDHTSKLYHVAGDVWGSNDIENRGDGYTYFAFALASDSAASLTGNYAPDGAENGILNKAKKITTFVSCKDIVGANKSYIGFTLDPNDTSNHPALDFLWVDDNADLSEYHSNEYLNRGVTLSVTGDDSVTMSGFAFTADPSTDEANNNVIATGSTSVSSSSPTTRYYARTSTVTLSGLGTRKVKVGNDAWLTPSEGSVTFTVPGGTESDYAPVPVVVSPHVTVKAGLAVKVGDSIDVPDTLMSSVSKIATVTMEDTSDASPGYENGANTAYTCTTAQSNLNDQTMTLTVEDSPTAHADTTFVGWVMKSGDVISSILSTATTYQPMEAGTYYAVYEGPDVTYSFTYMGRQNQRFYNVTGSKPNYAELAAGAAILNDSARSTNIDSAISTVAAANITVFNKTIDFDKKNASSTGFTVTIPASVNAGDELSVGGQRATYHLHLRTLCDVNDTSSYNGGKIHGTISGDYDTTVDITRLDLTAHGKGPGKPITVLQPNKYFYGWKKYIEGTGEGTGIVGDYISTEPNFGYSLTDTMDIVPIFGDTPKSTTPEWHAYVDKNELTIEMTGVNAGQLYNDSIIRFTDVNNSLHDADEKYNETGIVILAQTNIATSDQRSNFSTECNNADKVKAYITALDSANRASGKMNGKYGTAYAYAIETEMLSNLNRVNICQVLDYSRYSGGQYILAAYAIERGAGDNGADVYTISNIVTGSYTAS